MPPIMPGMTMRKNRRQSTLRWATWLMPDTAVVKVSAVWTPAEAAAGGTPMTSSKVLEICPNAMPSAPSTICAAKPIRMKGKRTEGSASKSAKMTFSPFAGRPAHDAE